MIRACSKGDRRAQEQLYKNYYRAMMVICLRYTGNDADAVEVLNNGFLKVFRNIERYDAAQGSFYTWMRTIVVHSCLDFIKSRKAIMETGALDETTEVHLAPDVLGRIDAEELLKLIRLLPPATAAVFNLYVVEGYNHKEIGSLLQISEGTSKWHLSEARKSLQQKIKTSQLNAHG